MMGKNTEEIDMTIEVPVSMVVITGLPTPAVETVEVNREAPAALFIVAAVPPPAITANAQVISGLKSVTVETITAVPAMADNSMAMVSSRLSTNGI